LEMSRSPNIFTLRSKGMNNMLHFVTAVFVFHVVWDAAVRHLYPWFRESSSVTSYQRCLNWLGLFLYLLATLFWMLAPRVSNNDRLCQLLVSGTVCICCAVGLFVIRDVLRIRSRRCHQAENTALRSTFPWCSRNGASSGLPPE